MSTNQNLEPISRKEALAVEHAENWVTAMNEEIASLEANETWTLESLPKGRKAVGSKWAFKIKDWTKRRSSEIQSSIGC